MIFVVITSRHTQVAPIDNISFESMCSIDEAFPNQPLPLNTEFLAEHGYALIKPDENYVYTSSEQLEGIEQPYLDEETGYVITKQIVPIADAIIVGTARLLAYNTLLINYDNFINAGYDYVVTTVENGIVSTKYNIDNNAVLNMTAVQTALLVGIPNAHGGFWRDYYNNRTPMTEAEVQVFFKAAFTWKATKLFALFAKKDAIAAATTLEAIHAVTLTF